MKNDKLHIKHGVYIAIVLIALSVIINITGYYNNVMLSYLVYPIIIAGILLCCIQYARNRKQAAFGNIFSHGFKTTCIAALLMIAWNIFSARVLFKSHTDEMMHARTKEMVQQGLPRVDVEKQAAFAKKNFFLLTASSTLLFYGVTGVVGSLIGASVAAKRK